MKETLEEATTRYAEGKSSSSVFQKAHIEDFIAGVEWQSERMYSEDDLREAYMVGKHGGTTQTYYDFDRWFEQFKNK